MCVRVFASGVFFVNVFVFVCLSFGVFLCMYVCIYVCVFEVFSFSFVCYFFYRVIIFPKLIFHNFLRV